ncbi:hypothetical protein C1N58_16135 [Pantoea sp. SGAir0180]
MRANAHCRRAQARPAGSRTHTGQVTVGGTPRCARSVTLATTTDYAPEPAPPSPDVSFHRVVLALSGFRLISLTCDGFDVA